MEIILSGDHFELLSQKAIFWRERSALIISDTHFGKTTHFRKAGIPIPESLFHTDMKTLDKLVSAFHPSQLIIVGDMFHSHHNKEIEEFAAWRYDQVGLMIHLVRGNHDILPAKKYEELDIHVSVCLEIGDFAFSHEPKDKSEKFYFTGHIHPGVRLSGGARQNMTFPCFHFTPYSCTLPAFSQFTGLAIISPTDQDRVYAIAGGDVIAC